MLYDVISSNISYEQWVPNFVTDLINHIFSYLANQNRNQCFGSALFLRAFASFYPVRFRIQRVYQGFKMFENYFCEHIWKCSLNLLKREKKRVFLIASGPGKSMRIRKTTVGTWFIRTKCRIFLEVFQHCFYLFLEGLCQFKVHCLNYFRARNFKKGHVVLKIIKLVIAKQVELISVFFNHTQK